MKWEYMVIRVKEIPRFNDTIRLQEELNNFGEQGWELVEFAFPPQIGSGWMSKQDIDSVIFKRQVENKTKV
jgi:hypothetical protein